jgi:predicted nucleic acid-binding protein
MACLDTCAVIDLAGGGGSALLHSIRQLLAELRDAGEDLVTTRFNVAELQVGIERSRDRTREAGVVADALSALAILEFDAATAEDFGRLKAYFLDRGTPRSDMDLLIASVARVNSQSIVTRNSRHFDGIPGLTVLTY